MKRATLTLACAAATSAAVAGTVTSDGPDLVIKTRGGLAVETADGRYGFELGGRIQTDYNAYDGAINKAEGKSGSDLFFRRARIELEGHAEAWRYQMSYNLTESGSIDQVHVTYAGFGPLAEITVGQQKEDFGLEDTGSSKWITAVERSLPANAFDTGHNIGVKLHGASDLLTYSLGLYREGIDADYDLDEAFTGRLVIRPWRSGGDLLHLGAGFTDRRGASADYNARLGVRGGEEGDNVNRVRARLAGASGDERDYNLELAAIRGPFHLLAEWFDGEIDVDESPLDLEADGYAVQAGWVVTGERRQYKYENGTLDKIKPAGERGAVELFARFDRLDVVNPPPAALTGGVAETLTLGVNWYPTALVKLSLDYVDVNVDQPIGGEGGGDAIAARLQFAF